jgi:WD40 repeat protein
MYGKQPMVVIWDVREQQLRKAVNLEVKQFDVTICPNSRLIATASNSSGLIRVWEAANGHCLSVFGVAEDKVDNVIFSPNSTRLAVQYRKGERLHQIYDISTGQTIFSLSNSYHPRAWSFGGNILAAYSASRDRAIIIVDATTGAERVRWNLGQGDSESIANIDKGSSVQVVPTALDSWTMVQSLRFAVPMVALTCLISCHWLSTVIKAGHQQLQ